MATATAEPIPAVMTADELKDLLGVSLITLKRWRTLGIGPVWTKVGHKIRYEGSQVAEWLANNRRLQADE